MLKSNEVEETVKKILENQRRRLSEVREDRRAARERVTDLEAEEIELLLSISELKGMLKAE